MPRQSPPVSLRQRLSPTRYVQFTAELNLRVAVLRHTKVHATQHPVPKIGYPDNILRDKGLWFKV